MKKKFFALALLIAVLLASSSALARSQSDINLFRAFASILQDSATDNDSFTQTITYDEGKDLFIFNTQLHDLDSATVKRLSGPGTEHYASLLEICKAMYDAFQENLDELGLSVDTAVLCTTSDGVIVMAYMNGMDCTAFFTP